MIRSFIRVASKKPNKGFFFLFIDLMNNFVQVLNIKYKAKGTFTEMKN